MKRARRSNVEPAYYERTSWTVYAFAFALLYVLACPFIAFFTPQFGSPNWGTRTLSWEGAAPYIVMIVSAVIAAKTLADKWTRPLLTADKRFRFAHPEPTVIPIRPGGVYPSEIRRFLPPSEKKALAEVNPEDRVVPQRQMWVYQLGGWEIPPLDLKSSRAGDQGYIVSFTLLEMFKTKVGYVLPNVLTAVHHDDLPKDLLTWLLSDDCPEFHLYQTPVYAVGALDPRMIEWLKDSPMAASVVAGQMGVEQLVDASVRRLQVLVDAGKVPGFRAGDPVPEALLTTLREEFRSRIQKDGFYGSMLAELRGLVDYHQTRTWDEVGQRVRAEGRLFDEQRIGDTYRAAAQGQAKRAAAVAGSRWTAAPPATTAASETPSGGAPFG